MLAAAIVAGGVICGIGMFNALMMSYTRLPIAMAEDGMLPRVLARRNSRGVPWVSLVACGFAWALALNLPFERLISIDLILYGSSLLLEFVALIVLRLREPHLPRPFRAGNLAVACLLARRAQPSSSPTRSTPRALKNSAIRTPLSPTSRLCFLRLVLPCSARCFYWLTVAPLARRRALAGAAALASTLSRFPLAVVPWFPCCLLFLLLRLAFLELLDRVHQAIPRIRRIVPALHLHPLAFQILVDREEVRNLLQHVRIDIRIVPDVGETRIVLAHGQHLFVKRSLVHHLQQANGPHLLHAPRKARGSAPAPARPAGRRRRSTSKE